MTTALSITASLLLLAEFLLLLADEYDLAAACFGLMLGVTGAAVAVSL